MAKPISPGAVTYTSSTDDFGVGTTYIDESTGKKYVWYYHAGADSTAAGDIVSQATTGLSSAYGSTTAATILDITNGTTTRCLVLGVALGVVATGTYAFLQCGGYCSNMTTDTNVTAGLPLACADGAKVAIGSTTLHPTAVFAYADAADAAAVGTGWLINCLHTAL